MFPHPLRRGVLATALIAAFAVPAAAPAVAAQKCANASVVPASNNLAKVRRATMCLVNRERTKRGLPKLHANRALRGVAQRYAAKMVAQRFFDHVSPGGSTFISRIQSSRYLSGVRGWSLGENIAYGSGEQSTPRRIVRAWMESPGHRANLLNGSYRDQGMGIALGTPDGSGATGATYANEFGQRTR
jgi:uncharacterized protein YkwD